MAAQDYYQLLEIRSTATAAEIKAAYRRLAKLYHPDVNAFAEEKFKLIKEAYETLINPQRRSKYDLKRNYNISQAQQKPKAAQKNYSFTEQEIKRRQYYRQHYGQPEKKVSPATQPKSNYRELTYLLVSIPAAVALLLLLINSYDRPKKEKDKAAAEPKAVSEIKTSQSPYSSVLGPNRYDTASHSVIKIENRSGNDAIVFLTDKTGNNVQHYFMENNYELFAEHIPQGEYCLIQWQGKNFTNNGYLFGNIIGNFKSWLEIDTFSNRISIQLYKTDTFKGILLQPSGERDTTLLKKIFKR